MILDSNASHVRNNFQLHKIVMNVIRKFMMTENEVVYYSIYLEKLGWSTPEYNIETYLNYVGFTVKIYLNTSINIISDYIKLSDPAFERNYLLFMDKHKGTWESINISPREVNKKHRELIRTNNIYCKQNYLDLNYIVDEVLAMSLPYSETRKDKSIFDDTSYNSTLIGNKRTKSVATSVTLQDKIKFQQPQETLAGSSHRILIESNPFISKDNCNNMNNFKASISNLAGINTTKDNNKKKLSKEIEANTASLGKSQSPTKNQNPSRSSPIVLGGSKSSFKPAEPNIQIHSHSTFLSSLANLGSNNTLTKLSKQQMVSNLIKDSLESINASQTESESKLQSINLESENSGILYNSSKINFN